jgi:tRNA1Val (adenine37-N6)-methyltransferase
MSNQYFKFKQFTVYQDKCAMKVCTDSCLFGAWLNRWISEKKEKPKNALDIGTGTGLLSLMLSQGSEDPIIDAIEIEGDAFQQARENISKSTFKERIFLHHTSLQNFLSEKKYDLIFSNPPFFENDLKSAATSKNLAKHSVSLTSFELIDFISHNLSQIGKAALLIPYQRTDYFVDLINNAGLFTEHIVHVNQTPKHLFFRTFLLFSKIETKEVTKSEITIKGDENEYTKEFSELLAPFYLNL